MPLHTLCYMLILIHFYLLVLVFLQWSLTIANNQMLVGIARNF